ncbi:hypothetical protein G210_0484, partial [Candida maltosa Xu316]
MSSETISSEPESIQEVPKVDYKPQSIVSLDCKILQYEYGIYKLNQLILHLRKLQTDSKSSPNLPLLHYIVLLVGNIFSISDKGFDPKLIILSNYQFYKNTTINITPTTSHIPYDTPDLQIVALNDIPEIDTSIKCLKQLENLCNLCLQGYKKKLEQAKTEKLKGDPQINNTNYYTTIQTILASEIFNQDLDLTIEDSTFPLPIDNKELMENENFLEASLIDMDIKELFIVIKHMEQSLNFLKPLIVKLKKPQCDDPYALHKIFLLTQRLNDIYTIVRRYGRKIYLSNYQHLTDTKFLYHCKNPHYFKNTVLKDMNDYFNAMKKNGTLIANLTRLIRQDAKFEVNSKNITGNMNFAFQGLIVVETTMNKLKEFGMSWIISELKFRRIYQLPKKNLFNVYQSVAEAKPQPAIAPSTPTKGNAPPSSAVTPTSASKFSKAAVTTPEPNGENTQKPPAKSDTTAATTVNRSRSSSVSSVNSNNSSSGLLRRNSVTSPIKPNSLSTSSQNGRGSPRPTRPNSMLFMQPNSSASNLEIDPDKTSSSPVTPPTSTRRRSNSQPIGRDAIIATSGAAAALSRNGSLNSSRTSPARSSSLTSKSSGSTATEKIPSPAPSKITQKLLKVEEEESQAEQEKKNNNTKNNNGTEKEISPPPVVTKMSAAQRFQQKVREQAKSGALVTQQKETFNSVTFDPNNSSKYHLRKYVEQTSLPSPPPPQTQKQPLSPEVEEKVAVMPQRRTRDQVTRHNTQRNSRMIDFTESTSNSDQATTSSSESSTNVTVTTTTTTTATGKKVRFTGVPEWTEAEDAPTKYSNAILRNFAVFRHPIRSVRAYNAKSDQLLKEESLSFRTAVEDHTTTSSPPPMSNNNMAAAAAAA